MFIFVSKQKHEQRSDLQQLPEVPRGIFCPVPQGSTPPCGWLLMSLGETYYASQRTLNAGGYLVSCTLNLFCLCCCCCRAPLSLSEKFGAPLFVLEHCIYSSQVIFGVGKLTRGWRYVSVQVFVDFRLTQCSIDQTFFFFFCFNTIQSLIMYAVCNQIEFPIAF